MRYPNENSARSGKCQYCETLCENVCCACRAWYCDDPCIEIDWNKHKNYCKPRTVHIDNYEDSIKINEDIDFKNDCSLKNGVEGPSVKEAKVFAEIKTPIKETTTPIPTDKFTKIVISWVEDPLYWVFRLDDAETQAKIEGKVNEYCTGVLAKPISPDDKKCCALFDGGWYRAEILSKDKGTAVVRFIDFGNDASIKLREALKIPEELLAVKPLAFTIKFMDNKPNNVTINAAYDVKAIKMNDGVCEVVTQEYTMKSETLSMKSPPPTVKVEVSFNKNDKDKSNGISVNETCHNELLDNQLSRNVCKNVDQNTEHYVKCNVKQEQCHSEIVKIKDKHETQVSTNVNIPPIPTDLFSKIVVTWEEEHCYWAFRLRDSATQSKIGEKLNVYCASTRAKPISPDDNQCCAPFDGGWYRAKILTKDKKDTALVRFIDFGNDTSIKLSEAMKLPEELLLVKPLAFQVKFVGGNPKEITINSVVDVKPTKMDGDICEVQLLVLPTESKTSIIDAPPPTVSVKSDDEAQVSTKVNTPPIPTNRFTKIVISWVDEPFYWAFRLDDGHIQTKIEEYLNMYVVNNCVKRISPDDNECVAPFDSGWYRAKILSKDNDTAVVRFIDFGNDASIKLSQALKVPDELLLVMPLAFKIKFAYGKPDKIGINVAVDVKAIEMDGDVCEVQIQGYQMKSETVMNLPPTTASVIKHVKTETNSISNSYHSQKIYKFPNPRNTIIDEKLGHNKVYPSAELNKQNCNQDDLSQRNELVKITDQKDDLNKGQVSAKVHVPPIPTDIFTKIILSWVDGPLYWAFKVDDAETQSKIEAKLNVYCVSTRAKCISPDDNKCCASFDGGWYRAEILSKDNDTALVRFIDFGNDASIKLSEALKLPEELLHIKPLAFKVKFAYGKPDEITINVAVDVKAIEMDGDICEVQILGYPINRETLSVMNSPPVSVETSFNKHDSAVTNSIDKTHCKTAINTQHRPSICDFSNMPQTVNERERCENLVQNTEHNKYNANHGQYQNEILEIKEEHDFHKAEESTKVNTTPIPMDKFTKIIISWVDEPFYWAFKVDDAETQSKIEEKLNVYCTSTRIKCITPNDKKCCASFDGGWYRAEILSKDNDTALVRFIDFGNDASIKLSEALKLPEELLLVKPLAFKVKFAYGKPDEITINVAVDVKAIEMDGDVCEVQILGYPINRETLSVMNSPPPPVSVETSFNKHESAVTNSIDRTHCKTANNTQHRPGVYDLINMPQTVYERQRCENLGQNTEHNKYNANHGQYQNEILEIKEEHDFHKAEESTKVNTTPIPIDKYTKILISWVDEPFYWAFKVDDAETQSKIEAKLNVYCMSTRAKCISPDDNKCCASFDGGWYRADILSKNNDAAVVRFMDFGNDASIKLSEALKVPEELLTVNPLAFQVKFAGGKPNEITINTELDVKAIKMNGDVCEVQIQGYPTESESSTVINSPPPSIAVETSFNKHDRAVTNTTSVDKSHHNTTFNTQNRQVICDFSNLPQSKNEREIYDNLSQNAEHNNVYHDQYHNGIVKIKSEHFVNGQKAEESMKADATTPIPTDKFTKVVISWIEEPFYWVFTVDDAETQSKIEAKLNVYCMSPRAKPISPNDNKCCAPFDGGWYRANILNKNNDTAVVRFMDFGNDASIKLSEALKVPEELLTVNPLAFQVKFAGGKPNEITMNTALDVKALKMDGDVCVVQILGYQIKSETLSVIHSPPPTVAFYDNAVSPSTIDITNTDILEDQIPPRTPVVHYFATRRSNHLIYQLEPSLSKISVQAQTFIGENCTTGFILVDDMVTSISPLRTIKEIAKQLATTKADPEFKPSLKDQVCACVGGIWYRGFVTLVETNKINIALIDLGVIVVPDALAPLPEHAKVFPETGVRCIFSTTVITSNNPIGEQFVINNLRKKGGKFLGDTDKFCEVAILPWEPAYEDVGLVSEKIKSGAQYKISVLHSPDEIYLHLNDPNYASSLIDLSRDIHTYSLKAPLQIRKPWCGQLISCLSPKNNKFYRAQVLKKLGEQYRVKFIDYGSIETVALSSIKSLSEELKSVPCFATKVGLKGIPGSSFNNQAIKIMNQLINKDSFLTVIVENDNPTRVKLFEGNNDINKLIYEAMLPSWSSQNKIDTIIFTSNDIMHEKWSNGENMRLTILAVKAFNEIVVTNEKSKVFNHAVSMTKIINDFCRYVMTPYNPIVQEICLAKYQFGNGNNWYRALCCASYKDSATVYFIDFGNYSEVSHTDIRKMPPEFLEYPAASKTCKVYGLSDSLPDEVKEDIAILYTKNYVDSMVVCDNNDGSAVLYIPRFMDILTEHNLTSIRPPPTPFLMPASNF